MYIYMNFVDNDFEFFSCHISNSECLRSHASKDENEGRDLIIAHLLNHVETYRSKLKKGKFVIAY